MVLEVVAPADGQLRRILKDEGEWSKARRSSRSSKPGRCRPPAQPDVCSRAASRLRWRSAVSASPAARKLADEEGIDIQTSAEQASRAGLPKTMLPGHCTLPTPARTGSPAAAPHSTVALTSADDEERVERRVPMTRLRASIARRLVDAQQNAAMLTTFNDVDMAPVMTCGRRYQEEFQARHNGTRLGFMSFFVRACCRSAEALSRP